MIFFIVLLYPYLVIVLVQYFSKMTVCSAMNCNSRSEKGMKLFRFPKNDECRAQWIKNMERKADWKPTVNSRLCEVNYTIDYKYVYLLK